MRGLFTKCLGTPLDGLVVGLRHCESVDRLLDVFSTGCDVTRAAGILRSRFYLPHLLAPLPPSLSPLYLSLSLSLSHSEYLALALSL